MAVCFLTPSYTNNPSAISWASVRSSPASVRSSYLSPSLPARQIGILVFVSVRSRLANERSSPSSEQSAKPDRLRRSKTRSLILNSFRAYYELIMSSFPGSPNVTSSPAQSQLTRPLPSPLAIQARAAINCFSHPRPNSTQYKKAIAILQTKNGYSIGRKARSLNASTTKPIFILSFYWRQQY